MRMKLVLDFQVKLGLISRISQISLLILDLVDLGNVAMKTGNFA